MSAVAPSQPASRRPSAKTQFKRATVIAKPTLSLGNKSSESEDLKVSTLQVVHASARTARLQWHIHQPDGQKSGPSVTTPVLISKVEGDDPEAIRVYEGSGDNFIVEGLKPSTTYKFRLRVWDYDLRQFSANFLEAVCSTTDEGRIAEVHMMLFRAVSEGDFDTFRKLMDQHRNEINIEMRDKNGRTILMQAAVNGGRQMVDSILKYGASPFASSQSKKTPLSLAATYSNLGAVQRLVMEDGVIDIADQGGSTPLMWAVEHANAKDGVEIVSILVQHGANVNREDVNGISVLHRLCSSSGNVKAARILLQAGATTVQRVTVRHKVTTLMLAALNGHCELCVELIDKWGANVWEKTELGQTAKMMADGSGHVDVSSMLDRRMVK